MLLLAYIGSDLVGKSFGGLTISDDLVAAFVRVALISSLVMPATVLAWRDAWRDRGENESG